MKSKKATEKQTNPSISLFKNRRNEQNLLGRKSDVARLPKLSAVTVTKQIIRAFHGNPPTVFGNRSVVLRYTLEHSLYFTTAVNATYNEEKKSRAYPWVSLFICLFVARDEDDSFRKSEDRVFIFLNYEVFGMGKITTSKPTTLRFVRCHFDFI